jgi:antitoxin VapB
MSLNIKNEEVYQLASELAQLTGRSMTAIVRDALRKERAEILRQQQKMVKVNELLAIADQCAAHMHAPVTAVAHGDMLYDDQGLPQ